MVFGGMKLKSVKQSNNKENTIAHQTAGLTSMVKIQ